MSTDSSSPRIRWFLPGGILLLIGLFAALHWLPEKRWVQVPAHATIEALGALAGLMFAGVLLFLRKKGDDNPRHPWVACALIGMGVLDGLHAMTAPGEAFVWLHSVATLAGGVLFTFVWLPDRLARTHAADAAPFIVAIAAGLLGVFSLVYESTLPTMVSGGAFTVSAKALNFLGGVGFFIATSRYVREVRSPRHAEAPFVATMTALNGAAGVCFLFSELWTLDWWLWHLLRLAAYVVAFGAVTSSYRRTEEALWQATRALTTLSACNQVVIRAECESALMRSICRTIVEKGGYRFVWVGVVEPGDTQVCRPVAQAGYEAGFLEATVARGADTESGQDPAWTAIRTGTPQIFRIIPTLSVPTRWQAEASRQGYAACLALPLLEDSRSFGTLSIYAGEPDAFDAEEARLMQELAADFSYGIRALRTRAAREEAAAENTRLLHTLGERVKELRLLHQASQILSDNTKPAAEIMPAIVALLPAAWQYPDIAVARVTIDAVEWKTPNFAETPWTQRAAFRAGGGQEGAIEVGYLEERPAAAEGPFLVEERQLLETVAKAVSLHFERMVAVRALRESESQLRAVLQSALDAVFEIDESSTILLANESAHRMFGWPSGELISQKITVLMSPEDGIKHLEDLRRYLETGESRIIGKVVEVVGCRGDGSRFPCELSAAVMTLPDGARRFIGVHRDITERKRAEETLANAKKEWEATFDAISGPIFLHDRAFRIVRANQAYAEAAGTSPSEFLGKPYYEVFPKTDGPHKMCLKAMELQEEEIAAPTIGKFFKVRTYGIRDVAGKYVYSIHVMEDITECKVMERQARRVEQLAAMGQLLGGIAHEMKNPLFVLTGRLQLLKEKLAHQEYDAVGSDLQKIEEAARRMTKVAQRFLFLAKPTQPTMQWCAVEEVLQGVLDFLANELMKTRIQVARAMAPDLPKIWSDPQRLHQVFLNLILNAVQAMVSAHGRGTLTVTVKRTPPPTPPPSEGEGKGGGDWIEVRIQDDGPGIPPEHQDKLFEPFFTTKPAGTGTGLGLWTVRVILVELNGKVTFETEVGRGTTFIVGLPVTKERQSAAS